MDVRLADPQSSRVSTLSYTLPAHVVEDTALAYLNRQTFVFLRVLQCRRSALYGYLAISRGKTASKGSDIASCNDRRICLNSNCSSSAPVRDLAKDLCSPARKTERWA